MWIFFSTERLFYAKISNCWFWKDNDDNSGLAGGLWVLWEQRSDQIFISRILIFEAVRSWSFISGMRQQTFCFQFLGQHIYIYYENIFEIWIKIFISYCLCKINDLGTQQINSSISNDIRSPGPRPAWLSWVVLITCYSSLICWAAVLESIVAPYRGSSLIYKLWINIISMKNKNI